MALQYYEKGQKLDQSYCPLIIQRIKTLVEIPAELGIERSWNIYYDQILQILKASQDLTIFDEFIDDDFEIILDRVPAKDQLEIIKKIFYLLFSIFRASSDKIQHSFVELGRILEKMGDKVKSYDNQFLYDESMQAFDQAINTEKPYPIAIKDKLKLLIKLNRNLEAQHLTEKFFKQNDIEQYQEKCVPLTKTSQIKEATTANKLTKKIIGSPNLKILQRKF